MKQPDFILFDVARHDQRAVDVSEQAFFEQVAWQQFTAGWRAQSELNQQLVIGLAQHNKSQYLSAQFFQRQWQELMQLQADFTRLQVELVAAVQARARQLAGRSRYLSRLGFL